MEPDTQGPLSRKVPLFIENYVVVQLFCNTSFKDHLDYIRPLISNFVGVEFM